MSANKIMSRAAFVVLLSTVVAMSAGCAMYDRMMGKSVALSGANEVPAVSTSASGTAKIVVKEDRSVHGSVSVSGMSATAAHIHEGAAGKNGPVVIPLTKTGSNMFEVPAGAKFTAAQYAAYEAGGMYVNVHSAAHKGGEVRGQLHP